MKIIITGHSKGSLLEIYHYYKLIINPVVARNIINEIKVCIKNLTLYPEIGQIEPQLEKLKLCYRRIICGNYKIIYRIQEDIIYITDIFDARRNPDEMKN
jgi:plasmid stabilization system protein ParE